MRFTPLIAYRDFKCSCSCSLGLKYFEKKHDLKIYSLGAYVIHTRLPFFLTLLAQKTVVYRNLVQAPVTQSFGQFVPLHLPPKWLVLVQPSLFKHDKLQP